MLKREAVEIEQDEAIAESVGIGIILLEGNQGAGIVEHPEILAFVPGRGECFAGIERVADFARRDDLVEATFSRCDEQGISGKGDVADFVFDLDGMRVEFGIRVGGFGTWNPQNARGVLAACDDGKRRTIGGDLQFEGAGQFVHQNAGFRRKGIVFDLQERDPAGVVFVSKSKSDLFRCGKRVGEQKNGEQPCGKVENPAGRGGECVLHGKSRVQAERRDSDNGKWNWKTSGGCVAGRVTLSGNEIRYVTIP